MKFKASLTKILPLLLTIFFGLQVCSAAEPKPSGFMDRAGMTIRGDLPFETGWIKPGVYWKKYRKMVVMPVETKYLMATDFWQEMDRSGDIEKDIKNLAVYTRSAFQRALVKDPLKRFETTFSLAPNPDTLRLEMALTELTPNKVFLKAAGYVPFVGLAAKAVNLTNMSHVSIEIRVKDARTGEILAKFADRKSEPFTIVSIDQFEWYSFAEKRIDQWAMKFIEIWNRKPGTVVSKSSNFDLKPW
jgi:Protein of unknown function (DUF3313)